MKKLISLLVLLLMLIPATVFAENAIKVVDNADVLTSEQETKLSSKISGIVSEYGFDVVIYFSEDTSYSSIAKEAADFYDYNGYGIGSDHEGILMIVNFANPNDNFYIMTTGRKCMYDYFPNEVLNGAYDSAMAGFGSGDFYKGADDFLDWIKADMYDYYHYVGPEKVEKSFFEKLKDAAGIAAAVGAAVSGMVTMVLKGQLKTEHKQHSASKYVTPHSFNIHRAGDLYLYTTRTATRIPTGNPGGPGAVRPSGTASTFKGSSGTVHGGGTHGRHI